MDELTKTDYNKKYYKKNREKILTRVRNTRAQDKAAPKVVDMFRRPSVPPRRPTEKAPRLPRSSLNQVFVVLLSSTIIFYLVRESARFFFVAEGGWAESYLKALILEGSCVALCIFRARSALGRLGAGVLLAAIYVFSVWAISGGVVQKAMAEQKAFAFHRAAVQELEIELSRARSVQDRLWPLNRISAARSYEPGIQSVQTNLMSERAALVQSPDQISTLNRLATLVGFRILVMLSNLVLLTQLGKGRGFCEQTENRTQSRSRPG